MMIFKFVLDLIAPKKCYSCKKEGRFLCDKCYKKLYDFENICYVCKGKTKNYEVHNECKNKVYYDKILVLKHYKQLNFDKHIKNAKFYNKKEIFQEFDKYMYDKFIRNEKIKFLSDYIIVSISSFFTRKIIRGYNSSEVLAQSFSKVSKIKYQKNIVKKIKYTRQQSKLTKKQRLSNLDNSFRLNKKYIDKIANKKIILVDDIISTGSTINEVSKLLKKSCAQKVIGLIIASD